MCLIKEFMMSRRLGSVLQVVALFCCVWSGSLGAHDDIDYQVKKLDEAIAEAPKQAELYLRRANLQRHSRHWDAALNDIKQARQLGASAQADLAEGMLWLEAAQPQKALPLLSQCLQRQPGDSVARLYRARAFLAAQQADKALGDFEYLAQNASPSPDVYWEWARAQAQQDQPHLEKALVILYRGIEKLGPAAHLVDAALRWEVARANYSAALNLLDKTRANYANPAGWFRARGDILSKAGRYKEAAVAYRSALDSLAILPPARRSTPAMQDLSMNVQASLRQIAKYSIDTSTK